MPFKHYQSRGMDGLEGAKYEPPREGSTERQIAEDAQAFTAFILGLQSEFKINGRWAEKVVEQKMILELAGLPDKWGLYKQTSDGWLRWELSDQYELGEMRFLSGLESGLDEEDVTLTADQRTLIQIARERCGAGSSQLFAAQVVDLADRIDFARSNGFANVAEALIFQLGQIVMHRQIITHSERSWRVGEKVRGGGKKGAENRKDAQEWRDNEIVRMVRQLRSKGVSKMDAYERVAEHYDVSISTVRRMVGKLLNNSR